jgi:flagellar basal-body rod modification protein FlgD
MAINLVNNITSATALDASTVGTSLPGKTLNQADFLKLLIAQMAAQDPLSPMSNTDFAAQMAQFSALQTSQATQQEIAGLRNDEQINEASGLIGRTVLLQVDSKTIVKGQVSGVALNSGVPMIMVGGTAYSLSQVVGITQDPQNIKQ